MLVDVKFPREPDPILPVLREFCASDSGQTERLRKGVYKISHFSFDYEIELTGYDAKYPELADIGCYGVCDSFEQVLAKCPELGDDCPTAYAISVTPIRKSEQSSSGGWRWHKWGEYIGTQNPQCEYLYDEKDIELVYVYHVYQIPTHLFET